MRTQVRVAVVDDRALVVSGLRAMLARYRDVEVVDHDDLAPGSTALVGTCAAPYRPRPGVRVLELSVERPIDDLVRALRDGVGGRRPRLRGQALSKREQAILDMTADGSSAHQIAHELGVSSRTVERHRHAVAEKLAVRSSSHAVAVGALGSAADASRR